MSRYYAAVGDRRPISSPRRRRQRRRVSSPHRSRTQAIEARRYAVSVHLHSGCACVTPLCRLPITRRHRLLPRHPRPQTSAAPAASSAASQPEASGGRAGVGVLGKVDRRADARAARATAAGRAGQAVGCGSASTSRFKLAAAAALLVALTSAITLGALRYMAAPVAADGMGTLVVQTNPSGAAVDDRWPAAWRHAAQSRSVTGPSHAEAGQRRKRSFDADHDRCRQSGLATDRVAARVLAARRTSGTARSRPGRRSPSMDMSTASRR